MSKNKLSQAKIFIQDKIEYLINEEEKTCSIVGMIFGIEGYVYDIIIPRSINYESNEYTIISILSDAFKFARYINSIKFSPGSQIRTIEKDAFIFSYLISISIPASLNELQKGWCHYTNYFIKIEVDPNNQFYSSYDKKFIIGKSTKTQENYDVLIFSVRNIVEAIIPKFIKKIEESAFEYCTKLVKIEFQVNSELQTIESLSFCFASLESISIPPSVTKICMYAFKCCEKLKIIEIPKNSKLETIEKEAFAGTKISRIFFPSSLIELNDGWQIGANYLRDIEIDSENPIYSIYKNKFIISKSYKDFDILHLALNKFSKVTIPKFIKIIRSYAFYNCNYLKKIIFEPNSELQIIEEEAFYGTKIKEISIPIHVKKIGAESFVCKELQTIEIPLNSELQTIEHNAFAYSLIEKITIPSNLIELKENWCYETEKLTKIEIDPKNPIYTCYENKYIIGKSSKENDIYDILVFSVRNIIKATIPKFIKIIASSAFNSCTNLREIEFPTNSELQEIESYAFSKSSIESISIPTHVTKIDENAFLNCDKIKIIEINENTKMKTFNYNSFMSNKNKTIILTIPVKMNYIVIDN